MDSHAPNQPDFEKAFASLVPENNSERIRPSASKFIKKLDEIPEIPLPLSLPRRSAVALAERGLVGQFTGLWPSPRSVQRWVERNWNAMVQGKIAIRFCGRGFYTFLFETVDDRNLIFRNGPYFMDSRGLYLNRWTPDFDPEMDVPNAVPVWVRLPHLPLHCWADETVRAIGNAIGKYVDRSEPKENMYACARICVEVDLGKGLPEAVKLRVDQWTHIQQVDYEQLPFKCKVCHEYGHFANRCPKSKSEVNNNLSESHEEAWELVRKKKKSNPPPESEAPHAGSPLSSPVFPSSSNPFGSLASEEPPSPPPSPKDPRISPSSPLRASPPHSVDRSLFKNKSKVPDDGPQSDQPVPNRIEPPLISSTPAQPVLGSQPIRTTRSSSKDLGASGDIHKKPGPGRKSAKQHREESSQKDIALGIQTPMDSFITGSQEKDTAAKEFERRAPPRPNAL